MPHRHPPAYPAIDWRDVAVALDKHGYAILPGVLPLLCWQDLADEAQWMFGEGNFENARVGRAAETHREATIRGDDLCWLNNAMPAGGAFLRWMDILRVVLNRDLFLGLGSFEAHYAHYPIGAGYGPHVDRHRDSNARVVSAVFYCNPDWVTNTGGEFVMYDAAGGTRFRLAPEAGTLLLFMSADMRHEACVATRERWSIAGWFRTTDAFGR